MDTFFDYKRRKVYSGIATRPSYSEDGCASFTFRKYSFIVVRHTRGPLLLSPHPRRCERLSKVEFGFGVRELLEPFDLWDPVFVGNDFADEDRFAIHLNPD